MKRTGCKGTMEKKLFFKPENAWVGDLIPYYEDGVYYGFYLHDPRCKKGEYAEETTWHLISTRDFVNVEYHGEAIARGDDSRPNRNAYTGSVIKDKEGMYHAFYTGYNADIKIDGKSVQTVMQAVGKDLFHLETAEDFIFTADDEIYESFDWRDPYVFYDEESDCYKMLLAARKKGAGALRGGCIALCTSKDLYHWKRELPFYDPQRYVTMECPEVFQMGGWYYLGFSTFSDRFCTHYRKSRSLNGPWIIPKDDVYDCRANYAIKTAGNGTERYAFGWIASKKGNTDDGPWEWGGTMDFQQIHQDEETGDLYIEPTKAEAAWCSEKAELTEETVFGGTLKTEAEATVLCTDHSELASVLYDLPETDGAFSIHAELEYDSDQEFGIALHTDAGMEQGYFLRIRPSQHLIAWDLWPRKEQGMYQWQIDGDIPYQIETSRYLPKAEKYDLLLIKEGDICVVYVNGKTALSTRLYDHSRGKAGIYITQDEIRIRSLEFLTAR